MFKIGQSYVFFVPPSWQIVGTVSAVVDGYVTLSESAYVESVADGVATLALGLHRDVSKAVTRSYPLPPTTLKADGVLIFSECASDITPLTAAREAAAIRGKR